MDISGKVIFITGGTGGIGWALTKALSNKGAKKVYVTYLNDRDLDFEPLTSPTLIEPIKLDVTQPEYVEEAILRCSDADIVVNNAGVEFAKSFSDADTLKAAEFEMRVNYHGTHYVSHYFLPHLKEKSEALLINVLSIGGFVLVNKLGTYCASKAAAHFLTKGLRLDCKDSNVTVMGVYPGYVDTAMTQNLDVEKVTPESIANSVIQGIESNSEVVFPDPMSESLKDKVVWDNAIFETLTD
ncbi:MULTISPECIES: SDR family NAD(P)-dependent oxidoreductase [unclassified Pseudoalteromonas]|uniref:SDR family NAD(P)-dependent oxidoreductase n=1 Tax=unclassified Pseudoalteromonas TaxID=194690 RepID=UPI000CF6ABB4|nr:MULTISPECIES: SDR family NAD(P)-dependent oxidoreductase [unclassified Pseudoalteromonas]MDE3272861.1 SDR family NAD(P)-dependent oxidoreductase [Pseudoalteromonas sp. G4]